MPGERLGVAGLRVQYRGLIIVRTRVPLMGSLKGICKGSIVGFYNNVGALRIRIGFPGILYYSYKKGTPPK